MSGDTIKAVIFDRGGVVILPDFGADFRKALEDKGLNFKLFEQVKNLYEPAYRRGEMSPDHFWMLVKHDLLDAPGLTAAARQAWTEVYMMVARAQPIVQLIRELRANGIKTAWLSATQEPHESIDAGLDGLVDFTFTTSRTHMDKDKNLYRHALMEMRLLPHEVLFVDDRVENVAMASEIGMHAFQMKWELEHEMSPLGRPSRVYTSNINELRSLLQDYGVPIADHAYEFRDERTEEIVRESMSGFQPMAVSSPERI